MNGRGGYGKSYTKYNILTTLVNEHSWNQKDHWKLATTYEAVFLIGEYSIYSQTFGMSITICDSKLRKMCGKVLKNE